MTLTIRKARWELERASSLVADALETAGALHDEVENEQGAPGDPSLLMYDLTDQLRAARRHQMRAIENLKHVEAKDE